MLEKLNKIALIRINSNCNLTGMNKMDRIDSHFIRQKKVQEEGCKGEPGTVRVSPANK